MPDPDTQGKIEIRKSMAATNRMGRRASARYTVFKDGIQVGCISNVQAHLMTPRWEITGEYEDGSMRVLVSYLDTLAEAKAWAYKHFEEAP